MIYVIVEHTVRDFDTWNAVFDEHQHVRTRYGATGHQIYRGADDPNRLIVVNQFASREQAEAFTADPSLKDAMERGGVVDEPRVTFVNDAGAVDYLQTKAA